MNFDDYSKIYDLNSFTSHRSSSWDETGGNNDGVRIRSKKTKVLADIEGPGIIKHIYITMILPHPLDFRRAVIKMFWDHEENPSVEVPLGDFFCVSNCRLRPINSLMITVNRAASGSYGLNSYFPMPFSRHARIEIENQGPKPLGGFNKALWYHVDYQKLDGPLPDKAGYFHAYWNRENLTEVAENIPENSKNSQIWNGKNATGKDNYVILDMKGNGKLVGLVLNIDNLSNVWYGEGDDMIFVDDDTWPPSFHGTGTEEIFGGGACPQVEYCTPYTGFHLIENRDYSGNNAMYRWFLHDPIRFRKRVRWTIEHGHANNFENDYSSVAFWYQKEPHEKLTKLPDLQERIPRFPENFEDLRTEVIDLGLKIYGLWEKLKGKFPAEIEELAQDVVNDLMQIKHESTKEKLKKLKDLVREKLKGILDI